MDDTCAVCAETLEWTAYGPCGHKDVCSTCVARLRFICNDRRCCICKTESDFIFVTKALGDYTATISDFSVLPTQPKEGRAGSYWYHEDTQAFFDDVDHYRMIKAMCKLSCSVCENMDDQAADASKRRHRFRNIDQLKGHLFHQHKLLMCSLCLEGRKVFICEQKLYTRPQLNQHISTGDSEVDGDESNRGGFSGHPICEFCHTPFYGDNELYTHMSTEHYTCHICQRQHPGQYEYYKNYDDLEIHFRRDHFLCEDESCLAKKFIVFQSEAEFKRHNTLEHAGRMSRSKRSAALQIPTSFRYRRSNEQDNHRGRGGRTFRRDIADDDLSRAIEASLGSAALDDRYPGLTSSNGQTSANPGETGGVDPLSTAFESLAATDSDTPARYRQAVSQSSGNGSLSESSFPPLPVAPSQTRSNQNGALKNTMAARIRKQNARNLKASGAGSAKPVNSRMPTPAASSPQPSWPVLNSGSGSSSGSSKPVADVRPAASNYLNPKHSRPAPVLEPSSTSSFPPSHTQNSWPTLSNSSGSSSASGPTKPAIANGSMPSSYSSSILASQDSLSETYGLSKNRGSKGKIGHSASAPNLDGSGSFSASAADFPPVSATQVKKLPLGNPINPKIEDVHTANKTLVERIQIALDFDEDRYTTFKDLSREYRQGLLDAETYMACVEQFGLSHLVPELAQLCPDAQKQKELMETYSAYIGGDGTRENGRRDSSLPSGSKDKKGKHVHAVNSNAAKENLADSVISTVRRLQSNYRPSEEDVEILTKDGYRSAKGKEKLVNVPRAEIDPPKESPRPPTGGGGGGGGSGQNVGDSDGRNKQQRKKTPKFLRVRLGDASAAALLDYNNSDQDPDSGLEEAASDGQNQAGEGLPVRGPWRNGGGQKLLASAKKK